MNHAEIEAGHVIDRYALGELDEAEENRFEEHLLICEECRRDVEAADRLREGFEALREVWRPTPGPDSDSSPQQAAPEAEHEPQPPERPIAQRPWFRAAAVILVAIPLFQGVLLYQQSAENQALRNPQPNPALITLSQTRGSGSGSIPLSLPAEPAWLFVAAELGRAEQGSYHAVLEDASGRAVWTVDGLAPDAYDSLSIAIHSSMLAPGDHVLRVFSTEPDGSANQVTQFPLRVIDADASHPGNR